MCNRSFNSYLSDPFFGSILVGLLLRKVHHVDENVDQQHIAHEQVDGGANLNFGEFRDKNKLKD